MYDLESPYGPGKLFNWGGQDYIFRIVKIAHQLRDGDGGIVGKMNCDNL